MEISIYCTCGALLEIECMTANLREILVTAKRGAGCEEEDYQRGYDDRVSEEARERGLT